MPNTWQGLPRSKSSAIGTDDSNTTEAPWRLFDLVQMQEELKEIFGREVDLVEKAGLRNPFRRHAILINKEVIYAA